jgi:hypothetical protein
MGDRTKIQERTGKKYGPITLTNSEYQDIRKAAQSGQFVHDFESTSSEDDRVVTFFSENPRKLCQDLERIVDFGATTAAEVLEIEQELVHEDQTPSDGYLLRNGSTRFSYFVPRVDRRYEPDQQRENWAGEPSQAEVYASPEEAASATAGMRNSYAVVSVSDPQGEPVGEAMNGNMMSELAEGKAMSKEDKAKAREVAEIDDRDEAGLAPAIAQRVKANREYLRKKYGNDWRKVADGVNEDDMLRRLAGL